MRLVLITAILLSSAGGRLTAEAYANSNIHEPALQRESVLANNGWIHGAVDCADSEDAAIDVYRHDETTLILRQNKCLSFEAPFIYVLVGVSKVLVLDTGATQSAAEFPLFQTIQSVIGEEALATRQILVVHSHSHSDHYKGDLQFKDKPNATIVNSSGDDVRNFFGFNEWPAEPVSLELGGRKLTVIPTPGHQEEAITIYDPQTKWLLTGDTVYPGVIYIKDWQDYTNSIARLVSFSASHAVSAILGAHIEMTREPGEYYPIGTTFQPDEAPLDLKLEDLLKLNTALQESDAEKERVFVNFIVVPMSGLQKAISNIARWLTQ
jgi:hydroxyacylglutathione hydrolase